MNTVKIIILCFLLIVASFAQEQEGYYKNANKVVGDFGDGYYKSSADIIKYLVQVLPSPYYYNGSGTLINSLTVGTVPWGNNIHDMLIYGLNFQFNGSGLLTKIAFKLRTNDVSRFNLISSRQNGGFVKFDSIDSTGDISSLIRVAPLNQVDTFLLPTPIYFLNRDCLRLQCIASSDFTYSFTPATTFGLNDSTRIRTSFATGSTHDWSSDTVSTTVVPIICFFEKYEDSIFVAQLGASNKCGYYYDPAKGAISGEQSTWDDIGASQPIIRKDNSIDLACQIIPGWHYYNNSIDGSTRVTLYKQDSTLILRFHPDYVWDGECINDIRSTSDTTTILDSLKSAWKSRMLFCKAHKIKYFTDGCMCNSTGDFLIGVAINQWLADSAIYFGGYYVYARPYYGDHTTNDRYFLPCWRGDGNHGTVGVKKRIEEAFLVKMDSVGEPVTAYRSYGVQLVSTTQKDSAITGTVDTVLNIGRGIFIPDSNNIWTRTGINGTWVRHSMTRLNDSTFQYLSTSNNVGDTTYYAHTTVMNTHKDSTNGIIKTRWVASPYDVDIASYFNTLSQLPDSLKTILNTLIVNIKTHLGVTHLSDRVDVFKWWANFDSISAITNIVDPTKFKDTITGMRFTQYRGFRRSATLSFGKFNYIPSSTAIRFTQTSCTIMIGSNIFDTSGVGVDLGVENAGNTNNIDIEPNIGSTFYLRMNQTNNSSAANTHGVGRYWGMRNGTTLEGFWNSTKIINVTIATSGLPNLSMYWGTRSVNGLVSNMTTSRYNVLLIGNYFTNTEQANVDNDILVALTALGAN